MRRLILSSFGLILSIVALSSVHGQDFEFYKKPATPSEYWRAMQFEIAVGKFEIAADHLKGLLDAKPTDKDLLDIEAKDGLVPFLRLRNVEKWASDKKSDGEVRQNVETLIKMMSGALKKELSNPDRITKFAKNLIATPEESAFALKELTRSGPDAIPTLLEMLRSDQPPAVRGGILAALPSFDVSVVPMLVAALDVNDVALRMDLLDSLRQRQDYLSLPSRAETDLVPSLWFFAADIESNPKSMQLKAREMLKGLMDRDPDSDREIEHRQPRWQLTQIARKFLEHKERFGTPVSVYVWKWDGAKPVGTSMSTSNAEEYYGLRYARWALEISPDYAEAQRVFITLALEKHFERSSLDIPLMKGAPALYAILATAPYSLITDLLENALVENRVTNAVALIQVIGDRIETKAARPSERSGTTGTGQTELRPSLLMKALDYPDRRVQFAAVDALLRSPLPHTHQRSSQIIKILSGYLLADPPEPGSKPLALIGDYDRVRAEALAAVARKAGFETEIGRTGKEVMRRLQEKADVDLVLIDHHLPLPALPDFLAQVRADFRTRGIPLAVIASPEKATTAHPITLLARLATLVAAEEHFENMNSQRRDYDPRRDAKAFRFKQRVDALHRLVESAGIQISNDVADRLEYLVFLTTPPNSMGFLLEELEKTKLTLPVDDRIGRMNSLRFDPKKGHIAAAEPPFFNTRELTPVLAVTVARHEAGLRQEILDIAKVYWQIMQSGQLEPDSNKYAQRPLPAVEIRYPEIEARLNRVTKAYKRVRVIPEVFSGNALKEEIDGLTTFQDPKNLEAEKKNNAKIAIEWLRKMAVGELSGYPVGEAEAALRQSLQKPELASLAIDAVGKLATKEAQQDIANVVLGTMAPEIRAQAADALIKHIQTRGKMLSAPQVQLLMGKTTTEESPEVKSRLLALKGILSPDAKETGSRLIGYTPAAPPMAPKEEPKEEPKKD